MNFYLPHEFGGFGEPLFEKHLYDNFNVYSDNEDLAIIKPKFTDKNEFKIDLPEKILVDQQN